MKTYPKSRYILAGIICAFAGMAAIFIMEYFWAGNHNFNEAAKKSTSGVVIGVLFAFSQYNKHMRQKGTEQ